MISETALILDLVPFRSYSRPEFLDLITFRSYSLFSRRFRRKSRLLQWPFFLSAQRVTSTFCALLQLMHIYQLLPYVLSTSFLTHPKRLT